MKRFCAFFVALVLALQPMSVCADAPEQASPAAGSAAVDTEPTGTTVPETEETETTAPETEETGTTAPETEETETTAPETEETETTAPETEETETTAPETVETETTVPETTEETLQEQTEPVEDPDLDAAVPVAISSISLDRAELHAPGTAKLTAAFTTTDVEISSVNVLFLDAGDPSNSNEFYEDMVKDPATGLWTAEFTFSEYAHNTTWYVDSIVAHGTNGVDYHFESKIHTDAASHLPSEAELKVVSNTPDTEAPVITDMALSSQVATPSRKQKLSIWVSDNLSGFASGMVTFDFKNSVTGQKTTTSAR